MGAANILGVDISAHSNPETPVELAFEGIQRSPRHKSGIAVRFPRILRWRDDKKPEDADSLETIRALLNATEGANP